ncbi:hypothetical protein JCM19231_5882 [Vibrio ishigakensis]|uniref:Uncharacterized protein n=1 Tax=Vibrio ishigakensis TaxID=1481914 RepID=A0A0B8NTV8_9VIBR|nr:hypothetical protein JCM19231_5882 [Vibrio ishigakensis]
MAINKLGEIDLDEEDRELIIHTYQSESPNAYAYLAEKAVAEYYMRSGFEVVTPELHSSRYMTDFVVKTSNSSFAVEVRSFPSRVLMASLKMRFEKSLFILEKYMEEQSIKNGEIVVVLRDYPDFTPSARFLERVQAFRDELPPNVSIKFGIINPESGFELIDL